MTWIDDNLLKFILIVQSLIIIMAVIGFLVNFKSVQKEIGKADSDLKKIKGELRIKYKSSGLSDDFANDFKKKIWDLMEKQKMYKKTGLKLTDLAHELEISVHQTSQIINQKFERDFNTFINEYRITEAIRIFRHNTEAHICDVLHEVGFNNKVTFNKAFKSYTNKTPSEFIAENIGMAN